MNRFENVLEEAPLRALTHREMAKNEVGVFFETKEVSLFLDHKIQYMKGIKSVAITDRSNVVLFRSFEFNRLVDFVESLFVKASQEPVG